MLIVPFIVGEGREARPCSTQLGEEWAGMACDWPNSGLAGSPIISPGGHESEAFDFVIDQVQPGVC
jgi:hypothetical protein